MKFFQKYATKHLKGYFSIVLCPEIFYENKMDKQHFYKKGPKGHFSNPLVKCGDRDMIIQFTTFLCREKALQKVPQIDRLSELRS